MKVSVIIPTYNRAELVCKTVDSVLQQTFTDYEIIIVDDGSTDNTEQALSRYKDKITYIKQENAGINSARNTALNYASGEYIALLDSDDLWLNFKLGLEVNILDAYPEIGFVFEDFFVFKSNEHKIPHGIRRWYNASIPWQDYFDPSIDFVSTTLSSTNTSGGAIRLFKGNVYHKSLFGPAVLPSASLYRRSASGPLRFNEDDSTCGDWEFFARLSKKSGAIFLDIESTLNRSHEDAVRLTRLDQKIQIPRMIALADRVWRQDKDFCSAYANEIDNVQYMHYIQLIKLQLVDSDLISARENISKAEKLNTIKNKLSLKFYKLLAYMPGSLFLLKLFRRIKRLIINLKNTGILSTIKATYNYFSWRYHILKEKRFDKKYHTETSKMDKAYLDCVCSENKQFAVPYEPIQEEVFSRMMLELDVQAKDYVFIDLGSGKARSLMYAMDYPYKKFIGVEFSKQLHEIAEKNISSYLENSKTVKNFELIYGDATNYKFPKDNIVLFLYNPFHGKVMQKVVDNINSFINDETFELIVLYRNPECSEMFDLLDGLKRCVKTSSYNIYIRK